MKICILAFDGLEANYVEKWKLRNLLQEYSDIYPVEAEKYNTPQLWASFLTGLPPEEHNLRLFVERGGMIKKIARFTPKVIRSIGKKFVKAKPPSIKGKFKTIFDYASKPLAFNVFSYNELEEQLKLRMKYDIVKTLGDVKKSYKAYREWMKFSRKLKNEFKKLLIERDWDLAMTHFYFTDLIAHLFYNKPSLVKLTYILADKFAEEIRRIVDDREGLLLIISDHGFNLKRGLHSDHGFYSLNKPLKMEIKSISDFYSYLIKEVTRQ